VQTAGGAGVADSELEREAGKAGAALYRETLAVLALKEKWTRTNGRWITGRAS
jgi:hypothetical protein